MDLIPSHYRDLSKARTRPVASGANGVVATGHQLATLAGLEILKKGGNAVDAGVAAGICLNVVHHDKTSLGGVAPILYCDSSTGRVAAVCGVGRWPKRASLAQFKSAGGFQTGIAHCVVPAAFYAWSRALEDFGTFGLGDVLDSALQYAQEGFPVHEYLATAIREHWGYLERVPSSRNIVAPSGRPLQVGDLMTQSELAQTLDTLKSASAGAGLTREAGIASARDEFYQGSIANKYLEYSRRNSGLFEAEDFAEFDVDVEDACSVTFGEYEICQTGAWSQGPVLLQALSILKSFDIESLGHNTAPYLHAVLSSLDLAFADREFYYGDPRFVDVPIDALLSDDYAVIRASLVSPNRAWGELPPPGNPRSADPIAARGFKWDLPESPLLTGSGTGWYRPTISDTSYVCVVDKVGNMFSATPSDTFIEPLFSPIVPTLGLPFSSRGLQSRLDAKHPNSLMPGKRPLVTTCPAIVKKASKPILAIGTPGGDIQPQAILQVLLNIFVFDMDLQEAVEQPRVASFNFPNSFYPFTYAPGAVRAEVTLPSDVVDDLRAMGHHVVVERAWRAGSVCVAGMSTSHGVWRAAADHRLEAIALGW